MNGSHHSRISDHRVLSLVQLLTFRRDRFLHCLFLCALRAPNQNLSWEDEDQQQHCDITCWWMKLTRHIYLRAVKTTTGTQPAAPEDCREPGPDISSVSSQSATRLWHQLILRWSCTVTECTDGPAVSQQSVNSCHSHSVCLQETCQGDSNETLMRLQVTAVGSL